MPRYIHGQPDSREVARLQKQAAFLAPSLLRNFNIRPGDKVLDLATGVGAMAHQLLVRFPGINLTCVDSDPAQLAIAQKLYPELNCVVGDAHSLPFADETFDRVHCSWLLEHAAEPVKVLGEVRRVLKTGGICQFAEVDNATFRTVPELSEVLRAFRTLNETQTAGGGNPYIGRELQGLMEEAGFAQVDIEPVVILGNAKNSKVLRATAEEFAEIFLSVDEVIPDKMPLMQKAADALLELASHQEGQIFYQTTVGRATR